MGDYLTIFGLWIFLALSFFLLELRQLAPRLMKGLKTNISLPQSPTFYAVAGSVLLLVLLLAGIKVLLGALLLLGLFLFVAFLLFRSNLFSASLPAGSNGSTPHSLKPTDTQGEARFYSYLLLLMGLCIGLGIELVYIRDFLDGGDYERMNTVFKFSIQAWLCFTIAGALVVQRLWNTLSGYTRRVWQVLLIIFVVACSIFLVGGTASRINDRLLWQEVHTPEVSSVPDSVANYTPTLDGLAFARVWYPGDAQAIDWLNANVAGSPVILEAASQNSYQWYSRVSVFTGLPDVLGWSDHEMEQRYFAQLGTRLADITTLYASTDTAQTLTLLHSYHVHYVYVGVLERNTTVRWR